MAMACFLSRFVPASSSSAAILRVVIALAVTNIAFSPTAVTGGTLGGDTTGLTDTTIKIGLFGPITGQSNIGAKPVKGAAAIYKDVNAKGGIHGRQIEIVIEDDGCDGSKGLIAVKKLISQDKVFLLHGAYCSAVGLAIKPEIASNPNIPYVVLTAAHPAISTPLLSNLFQPTATAHIVAQQMVEFALSNPAVKRIAIIRHSDDWASGYFEAAIPALASHRLTPVKVVAFERGMTDASAQVLSLKLAAPDAVLALLYPAEIAIYLRDAYKYGFNTMTLGTAAVSIDDTDKRIGIPAAVTNLYLAYNLRGTLTSPQLSKFAQIFKKYYPAEALDTKAFDSMGGTLAIVEVLKRAGRNLSRERFIDEFNKLQDFNSGVQAGPLTFSPTDHAGLKRLKWIALVNKKPVLFDHYAVPTQ
jgi:branched-chain amino acid transport system substrate-binding protein